MSVSIGRVKKTKKEKSVEQKKVKKVVYRNIRDQKTPLSLLDMSAIVKL